MKNKFQKMNIKKMLQSGFLMMAIFATIVGLCGGVAIISFSQKIEDITEKSVRELELIFQVQEKLNEYEKVNLKTVGKEAVLKNSAALKETEGNVNEKLVALGEYGQNCNNSKKEAAIMEILNQYQSLEKPKDMIRELVATEAYDQIHDVMESEMEPVFDKMDVEILNLIEEVEQEIDYKASLARIFGRICAAMQTMLIIVMSVIAYSICRIIVRSIAKPIEEIESAMTSLADGDFSVELQYKSENELGKLADKIRETISHLKKYIQIEEDVLNEMANMNLNVSIDEEFHGDFRNMQIAIEKIIEAMNDMFIKTKVTAETIDGASEQVSAVSQQLAMNATEQAASIDELVTTINQITQDVVSNAQMAEQMNENAKGTADKMHETRVHFDALQEAMSEISVKSEDIVKVVNVINDIANQTNLLSLNASIEAARAGDLGKGFGVVAIEIGQLAKQCADAVKSTEELVNESVIAVETGNEKVENAMQLMREIYATNEESAKCIDELAAVCNQQAAALEQTLAGTTQIAGAIQENSGIAEESSASSEELSAQAVELSQMLQKCQIRQ